uniref:Uncharacterized protein n=1 Tax=Leucosporidium scottii TaxID=5278 RepID=A0A0H5FSV7_9BASI|nr:hypothetical protein [Leucosporidium scottii]
MLIYRPALGLGATMAGEASTAPRVDATEMTGTTMRAGVGARGAGAGNATEGTAGAGAEIATAEETTSATRKGGNADAIARGQDLQVTGAGGKKGQRRDLRTGIARLELTVIAVVRLVAAVRAPALLAAVVQLLRVAKGRPVLLTASQALEDTPPARVLLVASRRRASSALV